MSNEKKNRNITVTVIVLVLIVAVSAVLILISLSMQKKSPKNTLTLTTDQIVTSVIKKMNYTNLSPISAENISRYYEIPSNTVSDSAMYISGKSGTEIELACFRLQNDSTQTPLLQAVNAYLDEKGSLTPSSAQTANAKVATHLPYIFVAVAQDSETAAKAFEAVLNDSLNSKEDTTSAK